MSGTSVNVSDHFVTINGLNIYYRDWGDRGLSPLVILHGGGNSISRTSIMLQPHWPITFASLCPINGEMEKAVGHLLLDDVLKLMDALGLRQTVLCGHSMGGSIAYMLASQYPEHVSRLVIVESNPLDPKVLTDDAPIELYATVEDAVAEAYGRQPYADKDTLRHEVEHGLKQLDDGRWTWRMDPALVRAIRRGQLNPGTRLEWPALAQIRCPSVLIYGIHSLGKMGTIVTDVAQAIPNCQLIEIPNASHDPPNENPAGFIRALGSYLIEEPSNDE